jgi:hypothetical protein
MANFMKLNARAEQRIGAYATRLLQIEAHLRRGEKRAATARLIGFKDEIAEFMHELEFPLEFTVIGSQLGFFSGNGSFLRGRLPAALVGAVAGWFYGQSQTSGHHRYLEEIWQRVDLIERALIAEAQQAEQAAQHQSGAAGEGSAAAESAQTPN